MRRGFSAKPISEAATQKMPRNTHRPRRKYLFRMRVVLLVISSLPHGGARSTISRRGNQIFCHFKTFFVRNLSDREGISLGRINGLLEPNKNQDLLCPQRKGFFFPSKALPVCCLTASSNFLAVTR